MSKSTCSRAISSGCLPLEHSRNSICSFFSSHRNVIYGGHEHDPDRATERDHRHRRNQPRRPRPRRRASSQLPAQIGRGRLEPDRRHAGPPRKADPARHRPRCWSGPRRSSTRRATAACSSWSTTKSRENEGDLVIPAQMATPDAINFMARHGRGLICLALTKERADQLGLEPMTRTNRSRNETAFTVSIEAQRRDFDRDQRRRPGADRRRGDRRRQRARRARLARPRLSAGRAARRRAGPRRPYRGGGRRRAARRAQPQRRHLRDHARGRRPWPGSTTSSISPAPTASRSAPSAISSPIG